MSSSAAEERRRTLVLVTVVILLERADEVLLPAVYREVGVALGASPTALGSLTLCRALVQALCYPLATCAAACYDRARVVAAGAFLWAVATLLVGSSGTFLQMAMARGFNGVGLALVVPAIYSLVADYSDDYTRGSAFGWVQMAQSMGTITGNSLGVLLAPTSFLGVPGWRLAFHALALVSASLAALTWRLGDDPRPGGTKATAAATLAGLLREAKDVVKVPTFQIIVALGVPGSVLWSALGFAAMWLELIGFTHWQTTLITNLNSLANALGALLAGQVGDPLARRFPDTGRIALAQVCTMSTVPLAAVLLLALPNDPSAWAAYAAAFVVLGFSTPWCPVSTNNPILAEIVPEKARTTVYALDWCLESVFASFGSPVVGILAEHVFGYQPVTPGTSERGRRSQQRRGARQGHLRGDRRADDRVLPNCLQQSLHSALQTQNEGKTGTVDPPATATSESAFCSSSPPHAHTRGSHSFLHPNRLPLLPPRPPPSLGRLYHAHRSPSPARRPPPPPPHPPATGEIDPAWLPRFAAVEDPAK